MIIGRALIFSCKSQIIDNSLGTTIRDTICYPLNDVINLSIKPRLYFYICGILVSRNLVQSFNIGIYLYLKGYENNTQV